MTCIKVNKKVSKQKKEDILQSKYMFLGEGDSLCKKSMRLY